MKKISQGNIYDRVHVAANPMYPAYVVTGSSKNLMIDCGINLFGPLYIKSLTEILGAPDRLDYLFITHSHYDHLGSAPYLKRRIPSIKIGGAPYINDLLQKESVIARMNGLIEHQRERFGDIAGGEDVRLTPIRLDIDLNEGDEFDLGGLTCRVMEVPGHTRDCLAYYLPEIRALFPGEAAGVPQGPGDSAVQVEFLSSFEDYLRSMQRMMELEPRFIAIGHGFAFTDGDAMDFLERSYSSTFEYRKILEEYLDAAGGNVDSAISQIVRREYDEKGTILQERNAYIMNLTAQVRHIASLR